MIDLEVVLHAREALAREAPHPDEDTPGTRALRNIAGEVKAKMRANPQLDEPAAIDRLVSESQGRVGLDRELCRQACEYARRT